jgi:hypothetical protein
VTELEAVKIAQTIACENGWLWLPPVQARLYRRWFFGAPRWVIWTNAESLGINVRIVLDDRDGYVLEKGFTPR